MTAENAPSFCFFFLFLPLPYSPPFSKKEEIMARAGAEVADADGVAFFFFLSFSPPPLPGSYVSFQQGEGE